MAPGAEEKEAILASALGEVRFKIFFLVKLSTTKPLEFSLWRCSVRLSIYIPNNP